MSFWSDFTNIVTLGAASQASGAVSAISDTGAALAAFFKEITDPNMWRSLAWLLLGIILFGFGLLLLLRKPIEEALGTAAKAVAL